MAPIMFPVELICYMAGLLSLTMRFLRAHFQEDLGLVVLLALVPFPSHAYARTHDVHVNTVLLSYLPCHDMMLISGAMEEVTKRILERRASKLFRFNIPCRTTMLTATRENRVGYDPVPLEKIQ